MVNIISIDGNPVGGYGRNDDVTIYINDTEREVNYIRVAKRINQLEDFEARLQDVTSSTGINYGDIVKIFIENKLLLKGRIDEIRYETDGTTYIKGYGMGILLANKSYTIRSDLNDTTVNLVNKFLSLNNNGNSPFIITGKTIEDYGEAITLRAEFDNKLQAIDSLTRQLEFDWWVSNGDPPYETDRFNFSVWRGSLAPVYSVKLSGDEQNGIASSRNDNYKKLINSITFLGRGEGINQIQTKFSLASTIFDQLDQTVKSDSDPLVLVEANDFPSKGVALVGRNAITWITKVGNLFTNYTWDTEGGYGNTYHYRGTVCILLYDGSSSVQTTVSSSLTETATTVSVADASSFTITGSIIIGKEVLAYTGKSANSFTGCTRSSSNTTASIHDNGTDVFQFDSTKYYSLDIPQSDSSISAEGLKEKIITDASKESERQVEIEASKYLLRNYSIIKEINFEMMDYFDFLNNVNVGDRVQVVDSDAGLDDYFRVLGLDFTWDMGTVNLLISSSNKKITETSFVDSIGNIDNKISTRLTYSQGSTIWIPISMAENCDNTFPLNVRVYIPADTVAINKAFISFKTKKYRAYDSSTAVTSTSATHTHTAVGNHTHDVSIGSGGAHTHPIPNHTHDLAEMEADWACGGGFPCSAAIGHTIASGATTATAESHIHSASAGATASTINISEGGAHTHDITSSVIYGIYEDTFPAGTPTLSVAVGTEGSETTIASYNITDGGSEEDIDISDALGTDVGVWKNIKFTPAAGSDHNRVRIEAYGYIQIFFKTSS